MTLVWQKLVCGWVLALWAGLSIVKADEGKLGEETVQAGEMAVAKASEELLKQRHSIKAAQLRTQYLQALLRLEERLTRSKEIDAALVVRAEVERFRRGNRAPDCDAIRLTKLRELGRIFSNEVSRLTGEFKAELAAFRKKHGEEFVSREPTSRGESG